MNFIKVLIIALILIWPIHMANTSIPEKPIFEHSGDGQIIFYNTHTDELLEILYKNKKGRYIDDGIDDIDYVLRCRLTGQQITMDTKLVELIDHIQDHFGAEEIQVISGYRSPTLNKLLRSMGRGVGRKSYHMRGKAVDIRIPGVPLKALRNYALSLKAGGVGYYPGPDFVHIDVGPVRRW